MIQFCLGLLKATFLLNKIYTLLLKIVQSNLRIDSSLSPIILKMIRNRRHEPTSCRFFDPFHQPFTSFQMQIAVQMTQYHRPRENRCLDKFLLRGWKFSTLSLSKALHFGKRYFHQGEGWIIKRHSLRFRIKSWLRVTQQVSQHP